MLNLVVKYYNVLLCCYAASSIFLCQSVRSAFISVTFFEESMTEPPLLSSKIRAEAVDRRKMSSGYNIGWCFPAIVPFDDRDFQIILLTYET